MVKNAQHGNTYFSLNNALDILIKGASSIKCTTRLRPHARTSTPIAFKFCNQENIIIINKQLQFKIFFFNKLLLNALKRIKSSHQDKSNEPKQDGARRVSLWISYTTTIDSHLPISSSHPRHHLDLYLVPTRQGKFNELKYDGVISFR